MKTKTLRIIAFAGITALSLMTCQEAFAFGYGFGAGATGGSTAYKVTNLNDSGAGSFRNGVTVSGNNVTFSVSGTIVLKSEIGIASNVTIDGTTANITIVSNTVSYSSSHNIIIKNIRFREGLAGDSGKCSLQGTGCHDIMIDHCSIENGRWDCFEVTGSSTNVTLEYCIIGQGVDPQYFGGLFDGERFMSIHHNLWIDNNNRNPKLKANSQYINNVIYNWIDSGGVQGGHSSAPWKSDFINNYFIQGPQSANSSWINSCTSNDQWNATGNFYDLNKDGVLNGSAIPSSAFTAAGVTLLSGQQYNPAVPVPVNSAGAALSQCTGGQWGCQPLDSFDTTLINYVKSYGTSGRKGP
jgi:pectate lyase